MGVYEDRHILKGFHNIFTQWDEGASIFGILNFSYALFILSVRNVLHAFHTYCPGLYIN